MDDYIQREADTMATIDHANVVKFFGLEQIIDSNLKALIMEYCSGGTLQQLISANPNGLPSSDFFRVGQHLVSAVEHLYDMSVVHRDIKPDNIVIAPGSNGAVYKLADFGSARHLQPEQTYGSLYGTYEYVHKDVYVAYHYKDLNVRPSVNQFNFTHEFWSIGVTLHKAASGQLPFNPTKGGADKTTMYKMISSKQNKDISAIETEQGIKWSQRLPESANMVNDNRVTKLLANLMKVTNDFWQIYHQNNCL